MIKKFSHESETTAYDSDSLTFESIGHQEKSSSQNKTIIGEHISIEGTIRADEDLLIQGKLNGSLELKKHHAIIGPQGKVEADVLAESVTISGKVTGKVSASGKVSLTKDAVFNGQIVSRSISIEDGAFVKATIEMSRNDDAAKQKQIPRGPTDSIIYDNKDKTPVTQNTGIKQKN